MVIQTCPGVILDVAVISLYSHRKHVQEGNVPDVYVYDELPTKLRVQIVQICEDAIGSFHVYSTMELHRFPENNEGWRFIHDVVAREHGVFELSGERSIAARCSTFVLECDSVERVLDLVEVSFRYVDRLARTFSDHDREQRGIKCKATCAINELNERFRRAGVGYRFESGMIIRIDSELIHSEVVQPALGYLQQPGFEGPRDEFLKAHAHYRAGQTKDAITNANNAFESTLKTICDQRGWQYSRGATASHLVKVVKQNGLFPSYLDKSFDQLAATLQSGLPKVRNEQGAHGQGALPRETPAYVAAYALHLAAAKILFLAEAHAGL